MNFIKKIVLFSIILTSQSTLFSMINDDLTDGDEGFTMIDSKKTDEVYSGKTSSKNVAVKIAAAKKLLSKATNDLNEIKDTVDSQEVAETINTLNSVKKSLRDIMFKRGPGFQIANKTKDSIWVSIVVGDKISTYQEELGYDEVTPGDRLTMDIANLNNDIQIAVYTENPEAVTFEDDSYNPMPEYTFFTSKDARGKTKYLTWNPTKHKVAKKSLYPQTGRLKGLMKVSSSNYNLSNNIKPFHVHLKERS